MWQGVVMIVGAVLTTGDKSCHLWDHLFNPDELKFIPGATVSSTLYISGRGWVHSIVHVVTTFTVKIILKIVFSHI